MWLSSFGVKNFKLFKEIHELDFGIITIFTGQNNSGKSSFIDGLKKFVDSNVNSCKNFYSNSKEPLEYFLPIDIFGDLLSQFDFSFGVKFDFLTKYCNKGFITKNGGYCKFGDFSIELSRRKENGIYTSLFSANYNGQNINDKIASLLQSIEEEMFANESSLKKKYVLDPLDEPEYFLVSMDSPIFKDIPEYSESTSSILQDSLIKNNISDKIDLLQNRGMVDDKYYTPYIKERLENELGIRGIAVSFSIYAKRLINPSWKIKSVLESLACSVFFHSSVNNKFDKYITPQEDELFKLIKDVYNLYKDKSKDSYKFIIKYFKAFEIGDNFDIELIDETFYKVWIYQGDSKFILTQVGSGVQKLIPLIFKLSTNIDRQSKYDIFGDEQVLMGYNSSIIVLEEPESNLHPNFQSKLADLVVECIREYDNQFIIETHSEYFIRKLQYLVAKKEIKPEYIALHYFTHPQKLVGDEKQIRRIHFRQDGILKEDFGTGFFDESVKLTIDLLNIQKVN